jgi:mRNA-degrading endonuclease HigB of HigAB toxin-antitoxin module
MNRSKFPSTAKIKKKIAKEVHAGQMGAPTPVLEKSSLKESLKKYPQKKPELIASLQRMEQKKKRTAKKSKRTTPGDVFEQPSAPHIVHVEGRRWIKTVDGQNVASAKTFQRKAIKRK